MYALYQNFRNELRKLRVMIEAPDWTINKTDEYLSADEFYKQVIRYRINEYFQGKEPTKKELLKLLSLWEIDL